jgi:hypothetical protein
MVEAIVTQMLNTNNLVFEPHDPVKTIKGTGDYFITREFGIKLTPELSVAMDLNELDVAEVIANNGILEGEWELAIDINSHYSKGSSDRLHGHPDTWHPGDPDEFEIKDYKIDGILFYSANKVIVFSPSDSARLKAILGDLTEDEIDRIREQYMDNLSEPDYDY